MFDLEKFKLKVVFDKNKNIHKVDIEYLLNTFLYYISEEWRGFESKEEAFNKLYERYTKIINKIINWDENLDFKKYLFYYYIGEELLNKKEYYFLKNDEKFKDVYHEFIKLLLLSYEQDGYLSKEEFFIETENLKKRFKKDLKEILKEVDNYTYKTRKKYYPEIANYFVNKFNLKEK